MTMTEIEELEPSTLGIPFGIGSRLGTRNLYIPRVMVSLAAKFRSVRGGAATERDKNPRKAPILLNWKAIMETETVSFAGTKRMWRRTFEGDPA